ncbi:MAG: hypothetical protein CL912_06925 [Deltaproteobacteria bacterium]|nr:hypothetical protein [Deltaproteobacteria bacterium]|tara:strand:- start:931 stop:1110 length:180 start_codon:yes stop_codon:yes gene_type:complete
MELGRKVTFLDIEVWFDCNGMMRTINIATPHDLQRRGIKEEKVCRKHENGRDRVDGLIC